MYSFENDYAEGACEKVLNKLIETNNIQTAGYGLDDYCFKAAEIIKDKINNQNVDVHFITGGTPCNVLAITLLKPYEAVICANTGHINVHETGAVEATGHKILSVNNSNGKLTPKDIKDIVSTHTDEHMVKPKMVFISNATELGTIYTKQELIDIYNTCKENNLYLYLDGARIGNGLMAKGNDIDITDIAKYTDIFYLGATKNGALLGEAMVIVNDELKPNFRYLIKQHCAMLAKGRTIGISFIALLEDDTYFNNADNANKRAQELKEIFLSHNIEMFIDSPTNQIFPILDNKLYELIIKDYAILPWSKYDDNHTVARFVCSWATSIDIIKQFEIDLEKYLSNI